MDGQVNYKQVEADIVVAMLPLIFAETPEYGNMVSNRDRNVVNRAVEIARRTVSELKGQ